MTLKTYSKALTRSASVPRRTRNKATKEMSMMPVSSSLSKGFGVVRNDTPHHPFSSVLPNSRGRGIGNSLKRNSTIEFRLIFSAAFALFLLTSVLERALPHKWSGRSESGEIRKSVIEQAREAAHISVGYAFMG